MVKTVNILGVNIHDVNMPEAVDIVLSFLERDKPSSVFTPNSEIIYMAKGDDEFKNILNSSELNTADGIGVVFASKILGRGVKERVPGYDLVSALLPRMNERKCKLFLLGGREKIAELARDNILLKYPDISIRCENGYFSDSGPVIEKINAYEPDFVLVCLGAPKQENWIHSHRHQLKCKVLIGAGGTLDVIAGIVKRAPKIFIKCNVEWLYRLAKNPKRIGRMMALPKFALTVLRAKRKER